MKSKLLHLGFALVAALVAAPIAAHAADLGPRPSYKAPAYIAPAFSWSGFYVGLNAGYAFGKGDYGPATADLNGYLVGGTVGYNFQAGSWVFGVEGDFALAGIKEDVGGGEIKVPWFGTARGRIGYAGWSNMLPYITGGAAFAKMEINGAGSESDTNIGWTVGAGLEYALWSNWSVKVEYLYADLGTYVFAGGLVDYNTHIVRGGINYRF
jgi:outer membrane immunogenic protein